MNIPQTSMFSFPLMDNSSASRRCRMEEFANPTDSVSKARRSVTHWRTKC